MLAEIVLPAGTDKVKVRDISKLFADSLHPAIPEDTPRSITRLMKMPTNDENRRQWCGENMAAFPVSLTDDDMAALHAGAWKHLTPLVLPISELEWKPYLDTFEKNSPSDWRLVPLLINPSSDALILRHVAASDWNDAVRKAALHGHLTPRHPTTFLPQPQAGGEWLLDCFVTVADLAQFAARFDFGVTSPAAHSEAPPSADHGTAKTEPATISTRAKAGRPKEIDGKAQLVHRLIESMVVGKGLPPGALPGSAADLLDACKRIEKAKTGQNKVFSTTEDTFKTWVKAAGYGFKTGRPVETELGYWVRLCVETMGNITIDIFT